MKMAIKDAVIFIRGLSSSSSSSSSSSCTYVLRPAWRGQIDGETRHIERPYRIRAENMIPVAIETWVE